MPKLSIIVCTYNPDQNIFKACLESIANACKNIYDYEIIIIDNHSTIPITGLDFVKNFNDKSIRIIEEMKQGLTPARLKGIEEANADILVYIDDDNIINEDFFEKGLTISVANPHIGAWSGQVKLKFEETPEEWTKKYWGLLVHREISQDYWSNLPLLSTTMPCGAGLFVKKEVANHYYELHKNGKRKVQLDRSGKSLFSAGDNDLAACACDVGLGVGVFHELSLDHFIPPSRTEKRYLLKLAEGISASTVVFKSYRNEFPLKLTWKNRIANFLRVITKSRIDREFYLAVLRGEQIGKSMINSR